MDFFRQLFVSGDFQPHGFCYRWNSGLVWLNVLSDALIALAYFTIPFTLLWFIRKRRDLPFSWMFTLFGAFIIACGTTHVMEVWNLWHAEYWLAGIIKAITALASIEGRDARLVVATDVTERKQTEEALRQSDERLNLLVQGVKDYAILMLDPEGRITTSNDGAERIKGYRADEIIGQHFSKFYTPEAVAQDKPSQDLKIAAEQWRFEEEGWRVRKDGTRFWASVAQASGLQPV
jgi:PAS domain S-box-containing protein